MAHTFGYLSRVGLLLGGSGSVRHSFSDAVLRSSRRPCLPNSSLGGQGRLPLLKRRWLAPLTAAVCVLAGICSTASAQSSTAIQSVRFAVFSAQPIKDAAFVPRPNAAPLKLLFQPTARSLRHEYRGPMPLRFVDPENGAVVAEANIPAGIQNALLLFSPLDQAKSGTSKLRYQIAVLDDGAGRHGAGGLAIINLSGLALSGKVNTQAVTLKPGLNPTLAVGRTATIKLSTVFKQRTYQSYAGTAALGRNDRALLILFPPFYPGGLEVQSRLLIDQPPSTPAAPDAKSR